MVVRYRAPYAKGSSNYVTCSPSSRPFLRRDLAEIREEVSIALVEISEHDMVTVERIPAWIKDEKYYYFYTISLYRNVFNLFADRR